MAFLCPSRLGRIKHRKDFHDSMMGRITGSDSMDTLYKVELSRQNANNPQTRRIILHSFSGGGPEELAIKQGQKVHILYRESDWAYVIADDKRKGYVPFSFCARMGKPPAYSAPVVEANRQGIPNGHGPKRETIAREESFTSDAVSPSFASSSWSDYTTFSDQPTLLNPNSQTGDALKDTDNGRDSMSTPYQNIPQFQEILQYLNEQTAKTDDTIVNKPIESNKIDKHDAIEICEEMDTYATVIKPPPAYEDSDSPNLTDADKSVANSLKMEQYTNTATSTQALCTSVPGVDKEHMNKSMDSPLLRKVVKFDPEAPQVIPEATPFVKQSHGRYIVLYDFAAMDNKDDPDWCWVQKASGMEGFVPSSFLFKLGLIETTGDLNVHKPVFPSAVNGSNELIKIPNQTSEDTNSQNSCIAKHLSDTIHNRCVKQHRSRESAHKPVGQNPLQTNTVTTKSHHNTKYSQYKQHLKSKSSNDVNAIHTCTAEDSHHLNGRIVRSNDGYLKLCSPHTSASPPQQLSHNRREKSQVLNMTKERRHQQQERPKSTPPFRTYTEDQDICQNSYTYTERQTCGIKHSTSDQPINVSKIIETRHSKTVISQTSSVPHYNAGKELESKHATGQSTNIDTQQFNRKHHIKTPEITLGVNPPDVQNPKSHKHRENDNQTKHATLKPDTLSVSEVDEGKQSASSSTCIRTNRNTDVTWQNLAKIVKANSQNGQETLCGSDAQPSDKFPQNAANHSQCFRNSLCNRQSSESIKHIYTNNQLGLANGNVEINSKSDAKNMQHQDHGSFSGIGQTHHKPKTSVSAPISRIPNSTQHTIEVSKSRTIDKLDEHHPPTNTQLSNGTKLSKQQNNLTSFKQERTPNTNKQENNKNLNNALTINRSYATPGNHSVDNNQSKNSFSTLKSKVMPNDHSDFHNFEEFVSEFDYKAQTQHEISMHRCETIYINPSDQSEGYWYWAYSPIQKRYGYVPKTFVKLPVITMI